MARKCRLEPWLSPPAHNIEDFRWRICLGLKVLVSITARHTLSRSCAAAKKSLSSVEEIPQDKQLYSWRKPRVVFMSLLAQTVWLRACRAIWSGESKKVRISNCAQTLRLLL